MIKINLTPVEELENPMWWVPDAIVVGLFLLFSYGSVYFYLSLTRNQIEELQASSDQIVSEINALQPEVTRYNALKDKITKLESKKRSLKRITESKLVRYLPIILLEHLQTLKPEGLWFRNVAFVEPENSGGDANENPTGTNLAEISGGEYPVTIELVGQSYDNIIIAEFMTALKSTQLQNFEKDDVRTQLFFSDVDLSFAEIRGEAGADQVKILEFKLVLRFKERNLGNNAINNKFSRYINELKNYKSNTARF